MWKNFINTGLFSLLGILFPKSDGGSNAKFPLRAFQQLDEFRFRNPSPTINLAKTIERRPALSNRRRLIMNGSNQAWNRRGVEELYAFMSQHDFVGTIFPEAVPYQLLPAKELIYFKFN